MSTTLANARILLSEELGDFWSGAATSNGAAGGTTIVDTLLMAKANDWIPDDAYDLILSGTYVDQERKISSLDNTTGTLTVLAHGGQIASAVTYEIHRLFTASEKRRALLQACKTAFPHIHKQIRDTSLTTGNWLRDGDFEWGWTSSALNTYWVASVLTQAKNTTAPYYSRGAASLKLSGAAGYSYQSNTQNPLLVDLKGKAVTFTAQVHSNTASDTRLSIYDGATTTYSAYHSGGSTLEELSVSATIAASPSQVRFAIHRAGAVSTVYVDDARIIGPTLDRVYIGDLGLAQNYPHTVEQAPDSSIDCEPWETLRNYEIGSDGWMYLHDYSQNYRLRICGIGYLDFLASGIAAETWAATVAIDSPQLLILTAASVIYLYTTMIMPTQESGTRDDFAKMLQYWSAEYDNRLAKFGMKVPVSKVKWGIQTSHGYKSRYGRTNY
jgi:hypothetical protein